MIVKRPNQKKLPIAKTLWYKKFKISIRYLKGTAFKFDYVIHTNQRLKSLVFKHKQSFTMMDPTSHRSVNGTVWYAKADCNFAFQRTSLRNEMRF